MNLEEVIKELRALNEPVPKPLRLPSPAEIAEIENRLRISFHSDYKSYLLKASDVVYGVLEPCTVTDKNDPTYLVSVAEDAWNLAGLPKDVLPICENNGDYYCMNSKGEIVFWSHNGISDEKWNNLATWIQDVWII